MQASQTKKDADPSLKDCANCGTTGAKLTCAKCKATHYCSKACQKQHWRTGHKAVYVTPEDRRPNMVSLAANQSDGGPARRADAASFSGECPICLDSFSGGTLCTLPCKHEFHRDCVEELRKQGVQQACPLCRTALPPGPEQLFEDASCLYVRMAARHREGEGSWKPRATSEKGNMARVLKLWTNIANQGHTHAKHNLGVIYLNGSGVAQDYKNAMQWFHKAAGQGDARAQHSLGIMYGGGLGVARDHNIAVKWFRKAADQGLANAQSNFGNMYYDGDGVAQDYKKAVQWSREAADRGLVEAQFNLGNRYIKGKGISQDYNEAAQWYRRAADQGLASAQSNLGNLYRDGNGVARDYIKAVRWYRKAADQGDVNAQYSFGNMYHKGDGVAQDYNKAVQWYQKAADQGLTNAQLNLGVAYCAGKGIIQDPKKALFFLSAAEAQGIEGAHNLRKEIEEAAFRLTTSECSDLGTFFPSKCTCCGRDADNAVKLKPCPRCKGPIYCGKECQNKHWKNGHKEHCTKK